LLFFVRSWLLALGELEPAALLRLGPLEVALVAAPSWLALEQRCLRHALTLALLCCLFLLLLTWDCGSASSWRLL
jgi:hypothetical protein